MAGEGEKSQTDEQGSSSAEVAALEDEVLDEQASSSAEVAALEAETAGFDDSMKQVRDEEGADARLSVDKGGQDKKVRL